MRRRDFIALLFGCTTITRAPRIASAQQSSKLPTIGYLGGASSLESDWIAAFVGRFGELGWVERRTVTIDVRWSEGNPERVAEIAAEFVGRKLDVILTYGGAVTTLKKATTSIPIVFAVAVDPIGVGLVTSLSHPGGNVTGLSLQAADSAGKRLELLRQIVPDMHRLAILFDASYPATVLETEKVSAAARSLNLAVAPHGIKRGEDIPPVLAALKGQADALYVVENSLVATNSLRIAALAIDIKLPTTFTTADTVRRGALMSYGANLPVLYRRAADYVDKILRGTKPGDLPVEQPTKFDLVINLKTAKSLGIEVPNSMQLLADEVIE
jgi:putative tryptophan/tyrosine transport system substrate-binding protein